GISAGETMRVGFLRRHTGRIDLRNHRKIAVIDGAVAYTGSQNLVDSTFKRGLTYEELNVRLGGPIALELQAVFADDWYVETGECLVAARYFPEPRIAGRVPALPLRQAISARQIRDHRRHGCLDRLVESRYPLVLPERGNRRPALRQRNLLAAGRGAEPVPCRR